MSKESDSKPGLSGTVPDTASSYKTLGRFNAFSDGAFAIAITLLVLELPVPPAEVAVLPFSTSLMVTHLNAPDVLVGVLVYGVNVLLASLALSLLIFYVMRKPGLIEKGLVDELLIRTYRRRWFAIGVNIFAILVALIAPPISVALYLVMSVLFLMLPFLGLHRRWVSKKR